MAIRLIPNDPVEIEVRFKGKTINIYKMAPYDLYGSLNGCPMEDSAKLSNCFVRIMTPVVEEIAKQIQIKRTDANSKS